MYKITIPANQTILLFDYFKVIINNHLKIFLRAEHIEPDDVINTASYDTVFSADEFDPYIHGFRGINVELCKLMYELSPTLKVINYLIDKKELAV